jgi:hypothetical protein
MAADWTPSRWLVSSSKDVQPLQFAPETDGVAETESFLQGTEFASETVLAFQRSVRHSFRRVVEEVCWDEDRVSLSWTTTRRAIECTDGPLDPEALLVRIPAQITALDHFGSSND